MKLPFALLLALCVTVARAAEPAPAAPAAPAASATQGPDVAPTKQALQQAFDGAMTCSALAALNGRAAGKDQAWLWQNRSFAFGILAMQFYMQATGDKVKKSDMDDALTSYANTLQSMSPKERQPFDEGCARKYAQIDQLCKDNGCPSAPPAGPEFAPPGSAPPVAAPATPAK